MLPSYACLMAACRYSHFRVLTHILEHVDPSENDNKALRHLSKRGSEQAFLVLLQDLRVLYTCDMDKLVIAVLERDFPDALSFIIAVIPKSTSRHSSSKRAY